MTDPARVRSALAPVQEALLEAARADAERVRLDAERDAARVEAEAARRAAELREESRRRGGADGAERLARARAVARREARALVLRAQRAAYDGLRAAATAAVAEDLHDDRDLDRLRAAVVGALGPGATVAPAPAGGLSATTPDGRRVDASAERLVDIALADLDVEGLWAP